MRPGGGCPAALLLAVGWLLLGGLPAARGANVTARRDPGRARSLDEEEHYGDGDGEGEAEEEAENYPGESEHPSQPEGDEEEEGEEEAEKKEKKYINNKMAMNTYIHQQLDLKNTIYEQAEQKQIQRIF